ncbi:hypothetical protein MAR_026415 [Mya arenaria]|uniref:Uncharacterized protein n=1 Tax=Mya arenaria TaxID=6604 RepID=A0ABY7ESK1_MYAAR|nr:hypothetical protein MAR_026415 [Mya arenaria]
MQRDDYTNDHCCVCGKDEDPVTKQDKKIDGKMWCTKVYVEWMSFRIFVSDSTLAVGPLSLLALAPGDWPLPIRDSEEWPRLLDPGDLGTH